MKKTVLIFGGVMAIIGGSISAINYAMSESPHYPFTFGFGLLLMLPADRLSRSLSLESSTSRTLWYVLTIVPNTILSFAVGALLGWVIFRTRQLVRSRRSSQ